MSVYLDWPMGYEIQANENTRARVAYAALQNTIEAVKLRARGYTVPQIADNLGVTPATVTSYLREALKRIASQDVEMLRGLEAARLDSLQDAIWDRAQEGDLRAIDRVIAISKARRDLLGIDKKMDKEQLDSGPKTLVIQAHIPDDVAVPPSDSGVAE